MKYAILAAVVGLFLVMTYLHGEARYKTGYSKAREGIRPPGGKPCPNNTPAPSPKPSRKPANRRSPSMPNSRTCKPSRTLPVVLTALILSLLSACATPTPMALIGPESSADWCRWLTAPIPRVSGVMRWSGSGGEVEACNEANR